MDSCGGDSGGSLVTQAKQTDLAKTSPWIVNGLVSFVSRYCGSL